jgi:hypothetical protein
LEIDKDEDPLEHRTEFRGHNEQVRTFVKEVMVDWEKVFFAQCLGIPRSDLEMRLEQDDFLTRAGMVFLRLCAGIGLELPEWPDHIVHLARYHHDDEVDVAWQVRRRDDGACIGYGVEVGFDEALAEAELCYLLTIIPGGYWSARPSGGPSSERRH